MKFSDRSLHVLQKEALNSYFRVDAAEDIATALDYIDTREYAVVITDLVLDTATGIDIARYVVSRDLPTEVIIVTGYDSVETVREAANIGVNHYLTKPLNTFELRMLVEQSYYTYIFNRMSRRISEDTTTSSPMTLQHYFRRALHFYNIQRQMSRISNIDDALRLFFALFEVYEGFNSAVVILREEAGYGVYYFGDYTQEELFTLIKTRISADLAACISLPQKELTLQQLEFYRLGGDSRVESFSDKNTLYSPLTGMGSSIGISGVFGDGICDNTELLEHFFTALPVLTPVLHRIYLERKVQKQAKTDNLTDIGNRRMFEDIFLREIKRLERYKGDLAVIMVDLDNFKRINDTYGHITGDNILRDFVAKVNSIVRGSDIFCRYGGEEFVLILPETARGGAVLLAERMRAIIADGAYIENDSRIEYTVSMGVACVNYKYLNDNGVAGPLPQRIIRSADEALYRAKENGKNRVEAGIDFTGEG
jgi:diguanylate cyclase (GGDEF)-like protein